MTFPAPLLLRSSDFVHAGLHDRSLRRLRERGILVRVIPGAYVAADAWSAFSPQERYVARVHAAASRLAGPVAVSHWSAAAVWGFPVPDRWPDHVQVTDPRRLASNRIASLLRRPGILLPTDIAEWEGLDVTTPARTAADLALTSSFADAVLVIDYGLQTELFVASDVAAQLDRRLDARRQRSARAALVFGSAGSQSPGESFSRVGMVSRGFARPELQKWFGDRKGTIGYVDFWWEEAGTVGECDGLAKYVDPALLNGRTPGRVFADEKKRDARLLAHPDVRQVIHWDYTVARNPDLLAERLIAAGIPRLNPRTRLPRWS